MATNTQQLPAGAYPNRGKLSALTYENAVLPGTISLSGSVSSTYDLSDWTLVAFEVPGTLAAGTLTVYAANNPSGVFRPMAGTGGATLTMVGTLGNEIIIAPSGINAARYIQLVAAGTQTVAQPINALVK